MRNRELCSTADTGYKNTLGSSNIGSFNRYVLITGVNYTVDMRTVSRDGSYIRNVFYQVFL